MEDLFAPKGTSESDLQKPPKAVERLFAALAESDSSTLPHLRAYATKLLANGRQWLGAERSVLPCTVDVDCTGLPIRLTPHHTFKSGSVITFRFFRARPFGKGTRQEKVLRWALKQLTEIHPGKSLVFEVCILSTGATQSIVPYKRAPDMLLMKASNLLARDFSPQEGAWDCAKCRHFVYCPA